MKSSLRLSGPINLTLTVRNAGNHPTGYPVANPNRDFLLRVYLNGHEVPLTATGKAWQVDEAMHPGWPIENSGTQVGYTLRPGETVKFELNLRDFFDMNQPGDYLVIARRRFNPDISQTKNLVILTTGSCFQLER